MAKPSATLTWANDSTYVSGPFIGAFTKLNNPFGATSGEIPGSGVVSQFYNANMNLLGLWSQWADAGTFLPDVSAHIVETSTLGNAGIASVTLGGTASVQNPLTITDNATTSALIAGTNSGTGFGVLCTVAGDLAAFRGTSSSATGPVFEAQNLSSTGVGFRAQTSLGTAFKGIVTSGTGLEIDFTSGEGANIAGTTGLGLRVNTTTGNAAQFTTTGGYAVVVEGDVATPQKAGLRLVPQQGDPSIQQPGDVWYNGNIDTLEYREGLVAKSTWSTQSGFTEGFNFSDSYETLFINTEVDLLTCSLLAPNEPRKVGYVEIAWTVHLRHGTLGGFVLSVPIVRIYDDNAGVKICEKTLYWRWNAPPEAPDMGSFSWKQRFLLPGTGERTYRMTIEDTNADRLRVAYRDISIKGVFDTATTP